jgi:addiction module RelE/StbE family toxin
MSGGIDVVKIIWTPDAVEDRNQIFTYIFEQNPDAAEALDILFIRQSEMLATFPEMGKLGRVDQTRELIVQKHYLLVYRVISDRIEIAAVLHTSRQWPPITEE